MTSAANLQIRAGDAYECHVDYVTELGEPVAVVRAAIAMTITATGMTDIVLIDGAGLVVSDDGSIDVALTAEQTTQLSGKAHRRYQIRRNDTEVTVLVGDISDEPR